MPKHPPRAITGGLNLYIGPLRIYVNRNVDGKCEALTTLGTTSIGRGSLIPEEALIELMEHPDTEVKRGPRGS